MIDRCLICTQTDWHSIVIHHVIAGVTAVSRDTNIANVPMRLSTTPSDLLVHLRNAIEPAYFLLRSLQLLGPKMFFSF